MARQNGRMPVSTPRTVVVAPHLDDAVYSASALLAPPGPADVVTVFTGAPIPAVRTSWDRACGFEDSDAAVRARRAEESAALEPLGVLVHHLGLLDAQYLQVDRGPTEERRLVQGVLDLVGEGAGVLETRMLLPLGCGVPYTPPAPPRPGTWYGDAARRLAGRPGRALFHRWRARDRARTVGAARTVNPDHLWVRDVLVGALSGRAGVKLGFYADYPYLLADDGTSRVPELAAAVGPLHRESLPVDREVKRRLMGCYASQVGADPEIVDPGTLPGAETLWLPR